MTTSKTQIFNIALNVLGVSSLVENSQVEDSRTIILNNYYNLAKEFILKSFDWNFASCFKTLSLISDNNELSGYTYCYDYPNDCLCARDLFSSGNYVTGIFKIGTLENSRKVIYTNVQNAILRYTKNITNEAHFSSEFSTILAYYLASQVGVVISGSIQKAQNAYEKYLRLLNKAKYLNAQEGTDCEYDDKTYIDSRY